MYRRIVCALDIGKLQKCERLLKRAAALVDDGGEIDVVHVVEEVPSYLADLPQEVVTDAIRDFAGKVRESLPPHGDLGSGQYPYRKAGNGHSRGCGREEGRPHHRRLPYSGPFELFPGGNRRPDRAACEMLRPGRARMRANTRLFLKRGPVFRRSLEKAMEATIERLLAQIDAWVRCRLQIGQDDLQ